MLDFFRAAVLGVLQGLTEFLPISSSAHLRIFPELFGWGDPGAAFTAVVQIGTEAAVPTEVDAGLAGPAPSTGGSSPMGQALTGAGLLLLVLAGAMRAGRRERGVHEA